MEIDNISYMVWALAFSAFFSGMEIAFVSSNKLRFELDKKQQNISSAILSIFYRNPQRFISTMMVGNLIALVVYGLLVVDFLHPFLQGVENTFLILLIEILIATFIVLLTGEFIPKTLFRINPNLWLRLFSLLIFVSYVVLYPISSLSTWLSIRMLRLINIKVSSTNEPLVFSHIDLAYLIQESAEFMNQKHEVKHEVKMFQNALDFSKVRLRDCCVPRTEIVALPYEVSVETLKNTFIETGLSKIVIYKTDIDNVIGYIHSSEMFEHQSDWVKYIKQIPTVPDSMAAQKLMRLFMKQKKSIAVVVDEFGGTAGIVTLEDIIEEIFGEIEDEHDSRHYVAKQVGEHEYVFSGRIEVKILNEQFQLDLPESSEYETLAGFVLYHYQHFPKINEEVQIDRFTCKCIKLSNNRIDLLSVKLREEPS